MLELGRTGVNGVELSVENRRQYWNCGEHRIDFAAVVNIGQF